MRFSTRDPWGVELTNNSEKSLTIVSIDPTGAIHASNTAAPTPLKPGDVIIKLGTGTTKTEMVDALKTGTSVSAEVLAQYLFQPYQSHIQCN